MPFTSVDVCFWINPPIMIVSPARTRAIVARMDDQHDFRGWDMWIENGRAGRGATSRVPGAYFADGEQHLDYDTFQEHIAPNTTSDFAFKGALRDTSTAVWRGMIRVEKDAQKTNAYQENRNLMLSPTTHAVPIPGLEILANDVRCTHGATVSRVDREATVSGDRHVLGDAGPLGLGPRGPLAGE